MIQNALLFQDAAPMAAPQIGKAGSAALPPVEKTGRFAKMFQVKQPAEEQPLKTGTASQADSAAQPSAAVEETAQSGGGLDPQVVMADAAASKEVDPRELAVAGTLLVAQVVVPTALKLEVVKEAIPETVKQATLETVKEATLETVKEATLETVKEAGPETVKAAIQAIPETVKEAIPESVVGSAPSARPAVPVKEVPQVTANAATTAPLASDLKPEAVPTPQLPDADRETGNAAQEQRAARLVKDLYGTSPLSLNQVSKQPSLAGGETAVVQQEAAGATRPDNASAQAALPEQQAKGGQPQLTTQTDPAAAPIAATTVAATTATAPGTEVAQETASEKEISLPRELQRSQKVAHSVAERGEPKQEKAAEEKTVEVRAQGVGTAQAEGLQKSAQGGASGDSGKKEQHEQKSQEKETVQLQPLGVGTQPSAKAETQVVEIKSADHKTALQESILSQVRDGVVTHDNKGNSQISIRLNPGELGELKIQVRMDDNRLRVEVQADNKMVKDLLLGNLDSLKDTLASKNFTMEGFDVSTGSREGFNSPMPDQKGTPGHAPYPKFAKLETYADAAEPARVNYLTGSVNNLLDVRF